MLNIVYLNNKNKIINGTLFYCVEYYMFLKQTIDVMFHIINISDKDLNKLKVIFKEKYKSPDIHINVPKRVDIYSMSGDFLVLDIKTLKSTMSFMRNKIFCYSNDTIDFKLPYNVTTYGLYDYQTFKPENTTKLKFYFDEFKPLNQMLDTVPFSTSGKITSKVDKQFNVHRQNLFNNMSQLDYYHTVLDTNNRMIIEAGYYNIHIIYHEELNTIDSAWYRYQDVINNKLQDYNLDNNDKLIKDILYQQKHQLKEPV